MIFIYDAPLSILVVLSNNHRQKKWLSLFN